jgi:hypothetical protein
MTPRGLRISRGKTARHASGVSSRDFRMKLTVNGTDGSAARSAERPRRSRWILAAAGIVAGAFLTQSGQALSEWLRGLGDPPALTTQLNNDISTSAKDGYRLVGAVHLVQFRAAGLPSRVLLLRPIDPQSKLSDRLLIYDVTGEAKGQRLKRRLLFEPRPTVRKGTLAVGAPGAPHAFAIRLRLIRNLDGQPGNEVIADVSEYAVKPLWPRPVYIAWDPASSRFEVHGLLSPTTTNRQTMAGIVATKFLRPRDVYTRALIDNVYLRASKIVDATGGSEPVMAYAVEAYVLREESLNDPRGATPGGLALTAGYVVRSSGFGTPELLQAVTWHINLRHDPPVAQASFSPPLVIRVGTNWSHLAALLVRSRA